jgi:hypothetical protein
MFSDWRLDDQGSVPGRGRDILCHHFGNISEAHPASYANNNMYLFSKAKATNYIHVQLVSKLRM